jgi:hypothetical protein
MKNRNWLTTENNLFVYRQLQQNAVKNDEEFACIRCLFTLSFGTPSDFRLRKKMRKVTVLPAVVQCSLVERHHYR